MITEQEIEKKRNELNAKIRSLFAIIDLIDGNTRDYENYVTGFLDEKNFLDQQILLIEEAKNRLMAVFR